MARMNLKALKIIFNCDVFVVMFLSARGELQSIFAGARLFLITF